MTTLDSNPATAPRPAAQARGALARDPRERLAALFDPGTLELLLTEKGEGEVRKLCAEERSGVVAGVGLVHGVGAVAFASDPRVQGGAMGSGGCAAIVAAYTEAVSRGVPIVGLWHSGGARILEGVAEINAAPVVHRWKKFEALTTG